MYADYSLFLDKIEDAIKKYADFSVFCEDAERDELKERLKGYVQKIEEFRIGPYLDLIEPNGGEGRILEEELSLYVAAKNSDKNYEVQLSYRHPDFEDEANISRWKAKLEDYVELHKIFSAEENVVVRDIALDMLSMLEARVRHLLAVSEYCIIEQKIRYAQGHTLSLLLTRKKTIEDDCFRYVTGMYGNLDERIVNRAERGAEERRLSCGDEFYSEMEKILLANIFNAEEVVERFNIFFAKAGLVNCMAVVDKSKRNCATSLDDKEFAGKTVVKIPADYEANGMELLRLISHESCHAITGDFQLHELDLGGMPFGRDADDVNEGVAVLAEKEIVNKIAGFEKIKHQAHPYYILAMAEIRKRSRGGKQRVNPGEIYDFILDSIRYEFEKEGFSEEEIGKEAQKMLRRVFRGMPGCRYYNTKDSMYFKGEELAQLLKDTGNLQYVEKCCVDPELIPVFLEMGVYDLPVGAEKRFTSRIEAVNNILDGAEWSKEYLLERMKNNKS